jgi:looped-hinge helix DNA binding domain, AbrB family
MENLLAGMVISVCMIRRVRIGKKNMVYIPKELADAVGVREDDAMLVKVSSGKIELIPMGKTEGEYWAEVTLEEIESVGEELSERTLRSNS